MILFLQAAPLLLLVALLLSGRAGPVPAVLAALVAAVPAVLLSLPEGAARLETLDEPAATLQRLVGTLGSHWGVTGDARSEAPLPPHGWRRQHGAG